MNHIIGQTEQTLICVPLVARSKDEILLELESVLTKQPDIIEWRADFFRQISHTEQVIAVANAIKQAANHIPVIFTIRSIHEGGQPISLSEKQVAELNISVCRDTKIDYIDCEINSKPEYIHKLKDMAAMTGTKLIGSFHNFDFTPNREELAKKFAQAVAYGMDVAKVAVMPQCFEDVLTLLGATLEAKSKLDIPLITISMGKYGVVSRMIGGVFGSALTFGVGLQASAPGQVSIEDLKTVLSIVAKSMDSK